jgi:hypothetical protein
VGRTFGGTTGDAIAVTGHTAIDGMIAFTISIWAYKTGLGGGGFGRMMQKGANSPREWVLYTNNNPTNNIIFNADRWASIGVWSGAGPFVNSSWHNIAVSYSFSATSNDAVIYYDAVSLTVTRSSTPSGADSGAHGDLFIGNDAATGGGGNWAGRLAHAAIWNRILSPSEIKAQYYGLPWRVPAGLITYLPIEGVASPEPNYAPQGNATRNGTLNNTVFVQSPLGLGRLGRHDFDGEGATIVAGSGVRSFVSGMIG